MKVTWHKYETVRGLTEVSHSDESVMTHGYTRVRRSGTLGPRTPSSHPPDTCSRISQRKRQMKPFRLSRELPITMLKTRFAVVVGLPSPLASRDKCEPCFGPASATHSSKNWPTYAKVAEGCDLSAA